jgi:tRNA threonylcarbamoyladenosine biosynthesis protein TsaB
LPVLPIDTLLLLGEAARLHSPRVLCVLDARMGQVYVAAYSHSADGWRCLQAPSLCQPEALVLPEEWQGQGIVLASNAHALYSSAFGLCLAQGGVDIDAGPQAVAMLTLAAHAFARGEAVSPAQALPLYVRDKVALTSAERAADNTSRRA